MTIREEEAIRDREFRAALGEMRRPEALGAIPGATFVQGPLLSWCCNAEAHGGIYVTAGGRTGLCGKCFEPATFRANDKLKHGEETVQ